jgi:Telomeric single stranded DNA binding POT1/CDC13
MYNQLNIKQMKLRSTKTIVPKEECKVFHLRSIDASSFKSKKEEVLKGGYKYTQLSNCDDIPDATYNIFAVVVDASYPHKAQNSERYTCTLKLVDMASPVKKDGTVETCTMVVFANKFEDCPIVQRVGDIIRVHRASVSQY